MKINISTNIYMKINRLCALYDWSVFDSRAQCVQLFQNKWKRCLIYIDRFEFPSVSAKYIRPTAAVVGWWQQLRLRSTLNIQCPQTIFFFYITSLHSRHTRKRHARRCIKSTFIFVMCIWRWQGIVAANIGLHINLIVDRMWCSGVDPCNNVPSYTAFNASHRIYDYESFIIVIVGWRQQTSCVFLSSFKHIKRLIMNRFFVFFFVDDSNCGHLNERRSGTGEGNGKSATRNYRIFSTTTTTTTTHHHYRQSLCNNDVHSLGNHAYAKA